MDNGIDLHDLFEQFLRSEGLEWKLDDDDEELAARGETPCTKGHDLLDELCELIQRKRS